MKALIPLVMNIEKNYELAKTYLNERSYRYLGLEPMAKNRKEWQPR